MKKVVYLILVACIILGTQAIYVNSVHAKVTYSEKKNKQKKRYGESIKFNSEKMKSEWLLVAPKYYNMSVMVDSKNKEFKKLAISAIKSWNHGKVINNKTNGNGGKKADLVIARHPNTYYRGDKTILAVQSVRYYRSIYIGNKAFYFPQVRIDTFKGYESKSKTKKLETLAHEMGHAYGFEHANHKSNKKSIMKGVGLVNRAKPNNDEKKVVEYLKKISCNRYNDYRNKFPQKLFRGNYKYSQLNSRGIPFKSSDGMLIEETKVLCIKK